jgi:hypothetical protein
MLSNAPLASEKETSAVYLPDPLESVHGPTIQSTVEVSNPQMGGVVKG